MQKVSDVGFRVRLTTFVRELLALPCMQPGQPPEGSSQARDEAQRRSRDAASHARASSRPPAAYDECSGAVQPSLRYNVSSRTEPEVPVPVGAVKSGRPHTAS